MAGVRSDGPGDVERLREGGKRGKRGKPTLAGVSLGQSQLQLCQLVCRLHEAS